MKIQNLRYLFFILASLGLFSCSKNIQEEEIIRPVEVIRVGDSQNVSARTFSGITKASGETELSFRIPGTIFSIPVENGQRVSRGTLLAQLDTRDEELQVKQAQAKLVEMKALLKQAKAEYERAIALYEANNISKSELDKREADYLSSKAQLDASGDALRITLRNLEYCSIYAPSDGFIIDTPPNEFQVIASGDTVVVFASDEPMEVDLGIPETLINKIKIGQKAKIKFDFLGNELISAYVNEIGVMADRSTTFPITVKFQEHDYRLRQGMACDVLLDFSPDISLDLMVVPSSSIFGDISGNKYVWVYDETDSRVSKRAVVVGNFASNGVFIKSGLKTGDVVVSKGVHSMEAGMKVKPL
jgi:RND family efflux transporter MFP subunit